MSESVCFHLLRRTIRVRDSDADSERYSDAQVTEMGAIVMPPVPAFYARPVTVDDIVNHSVGRALDLFGLENDMVRRWGTEIGIGS